MGKDTGNEVAWSLYLTEPAPSPRGALRIFTVGLSHLFVSFLFKYGKDSIRGIAAFDLNGEWYDLDDIARYVCPLTAFEEPVHYGYLVLSTQSLQLECVKKAFGWSPPGRLYRPESLSRGPRTRERRGGTLNRNHHVVKVFPRSAWARMGCKNITHSHLHPRRDTTDPPKGREEKPLRPRKEKRKLREKSPITTPRSNN
ncbi:hypothetical protein EDB86DRAFT_2832169 [Lactarius hatsudake]|nr:hypothetical protein EDB86DRAFT_2832169 [Lactarius hatsudake]